MVVWCCLATTTVSEPLRVAVISDVNGSYGSTDYRPTVSAAVARIIALKPDLVIATGDMVAGQRKPHLSEAELRAMWQAFHTVVSDPLRNVGIPLAVTPGNHDASAYSGFELERKVYSEQWLARTPDVRFAQGSNYPFYYAFKMGPARFISLDVTTLGALDRTQMRWLDRVAAGGGTQIAFSHLPLWPFAIGRETEVIGDPRLGRLMTTRGVDLHLSGHHHAFYPGAAGGLAVVSQACLGSGPRALIGQAKKSPRAITLLEIARNGEITVSALTGPRYSDPLQIGDLPRSIQSSIQRVERLDIARLPGVYWKEHDYAVAD